MVTLRTSFLGNVPLVPLCAGKRNTRKPLRRRHFLRLFLLFLFKEEKQQKERAEDGFRVPTTAVRKLARKAEQAEQVARH
jgi:hypothetical protein